MRNLRSFCSLSALIIATLICSACSKTTPNQTAQSGTKSEQSAAAKNEYDKALEIVQKPYAYATGNLDQSASSNGASVQKMLVLSGESDSKTDIFVINADGSKAVKLTNSPSSVTTPHWSPDGKNIIYGFNSKICIMKSDGSDKRVVVEVGADPGYSHDGRRIVYCAPDGNKMQIYTADVTTLAATRLTDSGNNFEPSFSPDARN
jgi:Tol biopolymer transport system component